MFDSVNRLFSRRGQDRKEINVTTSVLEDVSDYDENMIPGNKVEENVQDLDSFDFNSGAVIDDMLPDLPAIDNVTEETPAVIDDDTINSDVISSADLEDIIRSDENVVLSASEVNDDDYDDFEEI
jgi:hypothetical protein